MTTWQASGTSPQRGRYRFTVKEMADGKPWLCGEPTSGEPLRIIGADGEDLGVGFDLRPGTLGNASATLEEAHKVARFLDDWIAEIVLF
jgi:hypothetical protein